MEVGLSEAARLLGISESTARRRLRSGELPGRQVPTKQGFIWLVEVDDELAADTSDSRGLDALRGLVSSLTEQNTLLKAQVQAQQEQLLAKDTQIGQLHVLLQQSQAALPTPPGGEALVAEVIWPGLNSGYKKSRILLA